MNVPGPFPNNYHEIIAPYIKQNYFDPYSLKDVAISDPTEGTTWVGVVNGGNLHGRVVCLQANAKNRMGGYTGLSTTAFLIKTDAVVDQLSDQTVCNQVPLKIGGSFFGLSRATPRMLTCSITTSAQEAPS